jgi:hypothetical protein
MNVCASSSSATPWMRSSVDRTTREISDVSTMVTMNAEAIRRPSGRSIMLVTVV